MTDSSWNTWLAAGHLLFLGREGVDGGNQRKQDKRVMQ